MPLGDQLRALLSAVSCALLILGAIGCGGPTNPGTAISFGEEVAWATSGGIDEQTASELNGQLADMAIGLLLPTRSVQEGSLDSTWATVQTFYTYPVNERGAHLTVTHDRGGAIVAALRQTTYIVSTRPSSASRIRVRAIEGWRWQGTELLSRGSVSYSRVEWKERGLLLTFTSYGDVLSSEVGLQWLEQWEWFPGDS